MRVWDGDDDRYGQSRPDLPAAEAQALETEQRIVGLEEDIKALSRSTARAARDGSRTASATHRSGCLDWAPNLGSHWALAQAPRARRLATARQGSASHRAPQGRAAKEPARQRLVPLAPPLVSKLRKHMQGLPDGPDALVFPSRSETPLDPDNLRKRTLKPLFEEINVPWAGWHTLRHTFASIQLANGVNIVALSRALGHQFGRIHAPGLCAPARGR
ncbi:tyrosine-type recombinase/integrase [Solirubrobacter pauli]|uniref:tyrosine-type recombinase/integrase n=1 Tax=Solirubrobacter pauli TaxID=166793 RepID=UPI003CCC6353